MQRKMLSKTSNKFIIKIIAVLMIATIFSPCLTAFAKDWGLSFPDPGNTPIGSENAEYLENYDAFFFDKSGEKNIYLTFDAGYENGYTEKILDTLKSNDVNAAFFLVGNYIKENPELVNRMVNEGHIVGNHTIRHPDMSQITDPTAFAKELSSVEEIFTSVTGKEMKKYYRPPAGKYSEQNLIMAKDLGYKTIFWSLAYSDYNNKNQPSRELAFSKLLPRIHPGAVVLLHNTSETNSLILDELIKKYREMGYNFKSLDNLGTNTSDSNAFSKTTFSKSISDDNTFSDNTFSDNIFSDNTFGNNTFGDNAFSDNNIGDNTSNDITFSDNTFGYNIWDFFGDKETSGTTCLPILMYHQISKKDYKLGEYVITPAEFESDLKLLKEKGYTTITVSDLLKYSHNKKKLPDKAVMLTFDDGFQSDYVYAYPLLQKYGMKAVFSIVGEYVNKYSQPGIDKHIDYAHLSWDEIREMRDSGFAEFQSHTFALHKNDGRRGALKRKSESTQEYESFMSKDVARLNEAFIQHLDAAPTAFTCPFGAFNNTLKDVIKNNGFSAILTSQQKLNKLTGDPDELFRLNRIVRTHNMNLQNLIDQWEAEIEKNNTSENSL